MLGWIGGKYFMAPWLRQNSPARESFDTYAEIFGGAFWFYLENEEFFLDKKIYYNDYNVFITNFMASAACDDFRNFVSGREKDDKNLFFEYKEEIESLSKDRDAVIARIPDFDLAWKYIYKMSHSHSGIWTANYFYKFGDTIDEKTGEITRPAQSDKLQQIVNKINDPYYIRMLKKVTRFSCLDFQTVVDEVDSARTFFYLDPPYFNREHLYSFNEFSKADHERVAKVIKAAKGMSLLSYYRYPELEEWFPSDKFDWDQKEFMSMVLTNSDVYGTTKSKTNTEVIVGVNYNFRHKDLFDW